MWPDFEQPGAFDAVLRRCASASGDIILLVSDGRHLRWAHNLLLNLHELNLQQRQLAYLLDRCNSYATQATLVTGFAFTSFSAEALKDLDYINAPIRSFLFVLSGATTMALSIGAVGVSSYLTGKAERLAMEVDVAAMAAAVGPLLHLNGLTSAYVRPLAFYSGGGLGLDLGPGCGP